MTNQTDSAVRESRFSIETASNYAVIVAFIAVVIFFTFAAPGFLTGENIFNLISNKVVLLAIVALGMTIVIGAGGIDLSVGVSIDLSSMIFIMMIAAGYMGAFAVMGGLGAAFCVGLLNAFLINKLKINPFLATLGVLFIGKSIQQLSTQGGVPIYLTRAEYTAPFDAIARTSLMGIPTPIIILVVCIIGVYLALHRSVFGRYVAALGAQADAIRASGCRCTCRSCSSPARFYPASPESCCPRRCAPTCRWRATPSCSTQSARPSSGRPSAPNAARRCSAR